MNFLQFDEFHDSMNELRPAKKQAQLDVFCSKYSNSEAPISVIAKILSENYSLKLKNISDEFDKVGFTKVKHLAQATLEKVRLVQLSGDSLKLLNGAMEIYSKRLDDFLQSAYLEFQNGNLYNTQRICKELFLHKPTDMDVIMLQSSSFYKGGNYQECIDCLLIGKNINPNCTKLLNNLAISYFKNSEIELSKKYLSEVCRLQPSVGNLSIYAELLRHSKDFTTAELTYIRVLKLDPELYKVRNNYGELLVDLNKIQEAKMQFKIALNSGTECSRTLRNLGFLYNLIGKFEKAISYFDRALKVNPHPKDTRDGLIVAYLKIKEYQKAITELLKILKTDPENEKVLTYLALAYNILGNHLMSAAVYKKCLKLKPDDFRFNYNISLVYFTFLKNYEEAIIYLKKCIELNPNKNLYSMLMTAYKEIGEHINVSDIALILGDLYLESDELDQARIHFIRAVSYNPENAICHWKVGLIMFTQDDLDTAFSSYEKAIELNPDLRNYKCEGKKYYDKYKKYMESPLDK
ncbi:UDP-N-acetylglucosamine--peptide N-acetylglucosaminyltransferase-like [Myzus persicae]|uniref:UDP-N-acetylglucosamine--peptide N-acetylglucosaminyltransferase-like n=1 Tax=Myzus persicae TaxID=13164 RepID=UPI000B930E7D|nr:UDP-N-acetylglucosamine--peptide N-acetylglucosaminyltransferase-like [Myzus persicae]